MRQVGRGERGSSKAEALKLNPNLVCRRQTHGSLAGYVVRIGKDGKGIASARSAEEAWQNAVIWLKGQAK